MTLPKFAFCLLLSMCVVVGIAIATGEFVSTDAPAPPLERSAPGVHGDGVSTGLGWVLGVLEIVFFVLCLSLAVSRRRQHWAAFVLGGLIHLAVFTALVIADVRYADGGDTSLFLSFPLPTAWMLYALWPAPLFFMAWYWINFDRHVLRPEDMARFREIVEANRQQRESES